MALPLQCLRQRPCVPNRKALPVIVHFSLPHPRARHRPRALALTSLPTEFSVVGERRDDPLNLLLRDPDGHFYGCQFPDGIPIPVIPDASWQLEPGALDPSLD